MESNDSTFAHPTVMVDFASLRLIPHQVYTENELDEALGTILRSPDRALNSIPTEMRRPLRRHIVRRRVEAIAKSDYESGEELVAAAKMLRRAMAADAAEDAIEGRLRDARTGYNQARKDCEDRMRQLEEELGAREREIGEKHEQECRAFASGWDDPSKFREWNKPSGQLLGLRASERNLAVAGDFEGAKVLKKQADRLERMETDRAQQRAREAMELAFQQMLERQSKECEAHQRLKHKVTCQAQGMIDSELTPMKMAIKKLEVLQNHKPVSRRGPVVSKSRLVTSRRPEVTLYDEEPVLGTPRTRRRLANLRRTPKHSPLPLAAVEASSYVKRKRPSRRREPKQRKVADF
jgi:hypothetical protein